MIVVQRVQRSCIVEFDNHAVCERGPARLPIVKTRCISDPREGWHKIVNFARHGLRDSPPDVSSESDGSPVQTCANSQGGDLGENGRAIVQICEQFGRCLNKLVRGAHPGIREALTRKPFLRDLARSVVFENVDALNVLDSGQIFLRQSIRPELVEHLDESAAQRGREIPDPVDTLRIVESVSRAYESIHSAQRRWRVVNPYDARRFMAGDPAPDLAPTCSHALPPLRPASPDDASFCATALASALRWAAFTRSSST
jgi:hypothetical protein